jgi:hypothetical protein
VVVQDYGILDPDDSEPYKVKWADGEESEWLKPEEIERDKDWMEGKKFKAVKTFKVGIDMDKLCNRTKKAKIKIELHSIFDPEDSTMSLVVGWIETTVSELETKKPLKLTASDDFSGSWTSLAIDSCEIIDDMVACAQSGCSIVSPC